MLNTFKTHYRENRTHSKPSSATGKKNKKIALEKYNFIREHLLKIFAKMELTHKDLMEALYQNVKDIFESGVQWYGETVKLHLVARKVIERPGTWPEKHRLKKLPLNILQDAFVSYPRHNSWSATCVLLLS